MIMVFDRGTYEVVKSFLQDYWGSEYKRWIKKDGKKDVYIYIYTYTTPQTTNMTLENPRSQ